MPIRPYYLGENPSSPSHFRPQSMSQATLPSPSQRSASSSPTHQKAANRQSMPPQRVATTSPPAASPTQRAERATARIPEEPEVPSGDDSEDGEDGEAGEDDEDKPGRTRKGTMSKNFRFPPSPSQPPPPVPAMPPAISVTPPDEGQAAADAGDTPPTPPKAEGANAPQQDADSDMTTVGVVAPSSVEVPPPPPVEKERPVGTNDLDDEVGETEEISLN